jgi:hypothetical protein
MWAIPFGGHDADEKTPGFAAIYGSDIYIELAVLDTSDCVSGAVDACQHRCHPP